jgi:multidrug transporter EmrE-like cation transporter
MSSTTYLIICFFVNGLSAVGNKALIAYGLGNYVDFYVVCMWGCCLAFSLTLYALTRFKITAKDVYTGLAMGVFGALSTLVFMWALKYVDASVAFPIRSAGNIALTAFFACAVWGERISLTQKLGIVCALAAIYLLL